MGGAWHGAGARGHQQALRVVLAAAAAQAVVPVLAEAATTQTAHQALRHNLIEALTVLLGDEDPEEHGQERQRETERERKRERERERERERKKGREGREG